MVGLPTPKQAVGRRHTAALRVPRLGSLVVAFEENNNVPDFLRTFGRFRATMPRHRPIWGTRPARINPGRLEDSLVFVSFACAPAVIVIGSCRAYSVAEGRVTTLTLVCLSGAAALAADANAGQAAYTRACKSCHGPDGTPNPAIAKMMKVDMQDLKSAAVQGMSNDDIKKIITDGKGKMRPVASVSGAALDDVAAYIHSLKK